MECHSNLNQPIMDNLNLDTPNADKILSTKACLGGKYSYRNGKDDSRNGEDEGQDSEDLRRSGETCQAGEDECRDGEDALQPMVQQFQSCLNFGAAATYYTPAFVVGGLEAEGEFRSVYEMTCEFHDGKGSCFKKGHCLKRHPKPVETNATDADSNTAGTPSSRFLSTKRTIYFASRLPESIKKEPVKDIQFLGRVCHVVSPLEFYIIPNKFVACSCGCDKEPGHQEHHETNAGLSALNDFHLQLNDFMEAKKRSWQAFEYEQYQLVTVRCKEEPIIGLRQSTQLGWFRAIVLEKITYNNEPFTTRYVEVELFDYGRRLKVPLHEIACLPYRFVNTAPMSIKCALDGVIPIGARFSEEAVRYFTEEVLKKDFFVKYKSRSIENVEDDSTDLVPRRFIYSVELTLKNFTKQDFVDGQLVGGDDSTEDDFKFDYASLLKIRFDGPGIVEAESETARDLKRRFQIEKEDKVVHQNISVKLHERGYCLIENPFPNRPMILNGGFDNISVTGASFLTPEPYLLQKGAFEEILHTEKKRIVNVVSLNDRQFTTLPPSPISIKVEFPKECAKGGFSFAPPLYRNEMTDRLLMPWKYGKRVSKPSDPVKYTSIGVEYESEEDDDYDWDYEHSSG